jgi:hypothetical protein
LSYHFCTYFDSHYLPRGLALYTSLKKRCSSFELWILCLDEDCGRILKDLNLPEIHIVEIGELEAADPELHSVRGNRSLIEYYFTCTPSWLLHLFKKTQKDEILTYIDADLFFLQDPAPLFEEMKNASAAIIAHRFPEPFKHLERFGIYNVGWLSFRNDSNAHDILRWWRDRCLEWCYDRVEENRFADQKYLDDWPQRFPGVVVINHKGAGVAPWNIDPSTLITRTDGSIWVEEYPLLFYHFHGLKILRFYLFDPNLSTFDVRAVGIVKSIYAVYLKELRRVIKHFSFVQKAVRYNREQGLLSAFMHRSMLLTIGPLVFEVRLEKSLSGLKHLMRCIGIHRPESKGRKAQIL